MTPAKVLNSAADLIEEVGWVQGDFEDSLERVCALEAIYRAAPHGKDSIMSALDCLEKHLALGSEITADSIIINWNDAPTQTAQNVIATFRKAAETCTD